MQKANEASVKASDTEINIKSHTILFCFSGPIKYFVPLSFTNNLNKTVEIRTTLKRPFDIIDAQPKQKFRYILRPLTMGRVSIFAVAKESKERLLVNNKFAVSLLPNRTLSRYWSIDITGKFQLFQIIHLHR